MTSYVLILLLGTGAVPVATFHPTETRDPMVACAANAQRITVTNQQQRKRGEDPTYRGFIRAHCERIDR